MGKVKETIDGWAKHWVAQGVPALEAEAIAVGTFARGVVYARLVRLEAVADEVQANLPHLERVIRELQRQGIYAGALPGIYRGLNEALDKLDKEE